MAYTLPNYFYPQMQGAPYAQQPAQGTQPQQVQSSFVTVRNEAEARNYPVAFGNSVTFKDENAPYIYTKTMGFSQLDRPIFDKYKLVKEETEQERETTEPVHVDIEKVQKDIKELWNAVNELKAVEKYGV